MTVEGKEIGEGETLSKYSAIALLQKYLSLIYFKVRSTVGCISVTSTSNRYLSLDTLLYIIPGLG